MENENLELKVVAEYKAGHCRFSKIQKPALTRVRLSPDIVPKFELDKTVFEVSKKVCL